MVPDRRHGGHWGVVAAVVGCLAFSIAGETAETEHRAPVPEASQAVQAEPDRPSENDQQPITKPTWPVDIETGEKASRAECGTPKECRAEQRDYSDLHAQWQAADAAKGQESFARFQTYIAAAATAVAGIGTLYLIWTYRETRRTANAAVTGLDLTRRAVKAAEDAVMETRRTAKYQLRAYVAIEETQVIAISNDTANANILIRNAGQTPAFNLRRRIAYKCFDQKADVIPWPEDSEWAKIGVLDPRQPLTLKIALPIAEIMSCVPPLGQSKDMCIYGSILYTDAFKSDRYRHFRFFVPRHPGGFRDSRLLICERGNDAN
jgi:hypothetical protein